ncbi:MAG: hypothetical protein GC147_08065 [Porphyrobacter sp.]|nr:hypothetical protein [Porphyrobacter sp.]
MTEYTHTLEQQLARFLDGEMAGEEAAAFAARLEQDPDLAGMLRQWQANDSAIRADFDRLAEGGTALPLERIVPPPANNNDRLRWSAGFAMAASLAALMVVFTMRAPNGEAPTLAALERVPSGETAPLPGGEAITPVLTFAAGDGRWCREYAISDGRRGIACRANGVWTAEQEVAWDAASPKRPPSTGYEVAAGASAQALDSAYDRLDGGDPLSAAKEKALLERGWTARAD